MSEHVFLREKAIKQEDIQEAIDQTAIGMFEWGEATRYAAIGTSVSYSAGPEFSLHRNLLEVRVGFNPNNDNSFHYLRFTDFNGDRYYVDHEENQELIDEANRLYRIAKIAINTTKGRLSAEIKACEACCDLTPHLNLLNSPYGIPGAVMAGSERCECVRCGASQVL